MEGAVGVEDEEEGAEAGGEGYESEGGRWEGWGGMGTTSMTVDKERRMNENVSG